MRLHFPLAAALVALSSLPAAAEWIEAQCDIYPAGSDEMETSVACRYGTEEGMVSILREDGVEYHLEPAGDDPLAYLDQDGNAVTQEADPGADVLVFRTPTESVFVWEAAAYTSPDTGEAADGDAVPDADYNPTAPFTTDDYDATALLPCQTEGEAPGQCAAGISRMQDERASVTVLDKAGQPFTINFMADAASGAPEVEATGGHKVSAQVEEDVWYITVDDTTTYEVALDAILGD